MTRNIAFAIVAIALIGATPVMAKATPTIDQSQLAAYCTDHAAQPSSDVLLDTGGGKRVAITIHCGTTAKVSANRDTGESESGPTEAAEGGIED